MAKTNKGFLLFAVMLPLFMGACSSSSRISKDPNVYSSYDPEVGEESDLQERTNDEDYGPQPIKIYPLVLVLGPGSARTFAAAGVLRALADAKIPVGAVLTTGMSSLVGALYAQSDTINRFEWSLMKFKPSLFRPSRIGSFFGKTNDGKQIERILSRVFRDTRLNQTRLPLRIGSFSEDQDRFVLMEEGSLAAAVRGAIAEPGFWTSALWNQVRVHSASAANPFPVDEARHMGIGPVVVIDFLDEQERSPVRGSKVQINYYQRMLAARQNAEGVLEQADLVIRPDLRGIGYFDFNKRSSVIYRGKLAVKRWLPKIKELVGLASKNHAAVLGRVD